MKRSVVLVAALSLISTQAWAVKEGGGGDLQCDAEVQRIAGNLKDWLMAKGPESGGKLDLSSSYNMETRKPFTLGEYEASMIDLLSKGGAQLIDANCVALGDANYPVQVGDHAKICRSWADSLGVHVICDRNLFMSSLEPDQRIQQIHHEIAINIPGLEADKGPLSSYKISSQLASFTTTKIERVLAVMNSTQTSTEDAEALESLPVDTLISLPFENLFVPAGTEKLTVTDHCRINFDRAGTNRILNGLFTIKTNRLPSELGSTEYWLRIVGTELLDDVNVHIDLECSYPYDEDTVGVFRSDLLRHGGNLVVTAPGHFPSL